MTHFIPSHPISSHLMRSHSHTLLGMGDTMLHKQYRLQSASAQNAFQNGFTGMTKHTSLTEQSKVNRVCSAVHLHRHIWSSSDLFCIPTSCSLLSSSVLLCSAQYCSMVTAFNPSTSMRSNLYWVTGRIMSRDVVEGQPLCMKFACDRLICLVPVLYCTVTYCTVL